MRDTFLLAALLLLGGTLSPAAAHVASDTIYVDTDASGAEDGSSWTDAYTSLQDGLNAARSNSEEDDVWVAGGTYYPDEGASVQPDDRAESFRVESGIDLRGHFSGDEESLSGRTLARGGPKTILSGEIQQDGSASNNAYTVLRLTGGSAGEVHIENGSATGSGAQSRGGGAHVSGGTLHHAVLTGNRAGRGAALLVTGSPSLDVLQVTGNHATGSGALYFNGDASTVEHLTVADNTADSGPTGLYFIDSDAALEDVAAGSNASSAVAERIPITFTTKTVGDTLYTNGYGETLTYQVSTDDTTFTATGGESANVPIKDGDNLEISSSDSAYLSTIAGNNTDGEPKPFNVSGFPDEPDYQNTTISVPKASVTNQYQIVGFPDTSPDGRDVGNIYVPFVNEATRYTERQAGNETLDQVPIWIFNENDSFVNKAQNAVDAVRDVLPYSTEGPYVISGTNALIDSAEARNEFNYHYVEGGSNGNNQFYDSGYIESGSNRFSGAAVKRTRISETYSGLVDMEQQNGTEINVYVFDSDGSFDENEAAFPVNMEYNSKPGSILQP
ncbi:hypothetical protein [Salinibacter grassmerensis]|uniref:hypothetical protein n=1 Tax=Salinibacter grassmerensis TaxID=3040353 RepID=UPI0021E9A45B|nr:hypothetical protein [Salinibacter grassmerensis]